MSRRRKWSLSAKGKRQRSRSSAAALMFLKEPEPPRKLSISSNGDDSVSWTVQKSSGGTKEECKLIFGDAAIAYLDPTTDDLKEKYLYEYCYAPRYLKGLNILSFMYQSITDETARCRVVMHVTDHQEARAILKLLSRKLGLTEAEESLPIIKEQESSAQSMIVTKRSTTTEPQKSPESSKKNTGTHSPLCRATVDTKLTPAKKLAALEDKKRMRSKSKPPVKRKTLMEELDT